MVHAWVSNCIIIVVIISKTQKRLRQWIHVKAVILQVKLLLNVTAAVSGKAFTNTLVFSCYCRTTPIFTVSSVTGKDLDLLKQFLNVIPPRQSQEEQEKLMQDDPEYLVSRFGIYLYTNN